MLPSGDVTFAFVDVVGSTPLFEQHGDRFVQALSGVHREIAAAAASGGGVVVSTEGDGAFLAFPEAASASQALVELQRSRATQPPGPLEVLLRVGLHRGPATPVDGGYVALPVHVAARVCAAARAGQVLASGAVVDALGPSAREARPVGSWRLRGLAAAVPLWLLEGPDALPDAEPERLTNVQVGRTSFLGREELATRVCDELAFPGPVTLVGPGGVGKTRLASEVALSTAPETPHGVWMVELGAVRPGEVAGAVAETLLGRRASDPHSAVAAELASRPSLVLVLDNCEHLVDEVADLLSDLLRKAPHLRALCTSREPLRLAEERVVPVKPLDAGGPEDGLGPAELLFLSRAASAGAVIPPERIPVVREVCRQLDGLPLAIELAAARATDLPLEHLARALQSATGPGRDRRGAEPRQRSLEGLVAWSDEHLPLPSRRALRVLCALPPPFSGSAAREVLAHAARLVGDVDPDAVPELAARSLVDLSGSTYRLLETVRAVVTRWLDADAALAAGARQALVDWGAEWGERHKDVPRDDIIASVREDVAPLSAAAVLALRAHDDRCADLLYCLGTVNQALGLPPELRTAAAEAFAWANGPARSAARLRSFALPLVSGATFAGRSPLEPEALLELVAATDQVGDVRDRVQVRQHVYVRLPVPGMRETCERLHQEATELCQDQPALTRSREILKADAGYIAHVCGDLDSAIARYREAVPVIMAGTNRMLQATTTSNLGEALLDAGRPEEALQVLQEATLLAADTPVLYAGASGLLGEAHASLGQGQEAAVYLERAVEMLASLVHADGSLEYYRERAQAALASLTRTTESSAGQGARV